MVMSYSLPLWNFSQDVLTRRKLELGFVLFLREHEISGEFVTAFGDEIFDKVRLCLRRSLWLWRDRSSPVPCVGRACPPCRFSEHAAEIPNESAHRCATKTHRTDGL